MRNKFVKITVILLLAVLLLLVALLSVFSGVGGKKTVISGGEAAPAAAPEQIVTTPFVTLVADGREITVEDTAGKTIQQLLDQARIDLGEDDFVTVSPEQLLDGTLTIRVIRKCSVTVIVAGDDTSDESRCVILLAEGTVADAISAAGVQLEDYHIVNFDLEQSVEDGMEILISVEKVEEETEPETEPKTESATPKPSTPSTPKPTEPKPTEPKPTEPKPTEPKPTEPTEPERTIVSVEVYEDCDGSGHGVKVITYSDGTQEEVYF